MQAQAAAALCMSTLSVIDRQPAPSDALFGQWFAWSQYARWIEQLQDWAAGAPPIIALDEFPDRAVRTATDPDGRWFVDQVNVGDLGFLTHRTAPIEAVHRTGTAALFGIAAEVSMQASDVVRMGQARPLRRAAESYREWSARAAAALELIPDSWAVDLFALQESQPAEGTAVIPITRPIRLRNP